MKTIAKKTAYKLIKEILQSEDYKTLVKKQREYVLNFLSKNGNEPKALNLKDELRKFREKVYLKFRKIPFKFVVLYYGQCGDEELMTNYIHALIGKQVKPIAKFLRQPVFINFSLYSFKTRKILPMTSFHYFYSFDHMQKNYKDFEELIFFRSELTDYKSVLEAIAEQNDPTILIFEREGDEIKGRNINSARNIDDPKDDEPYNYKQLRYENTEKLNVLLKKWEALDKTNKEEVDEFNSALKEYVKDLEGRNGKDFKNLLNIYKKQFRKILTKEYVEQKTGLPFEEGIKLYFWTFYFGTIRMIFEDNAIGNIYFLPIITGKENKYVGGAVVVNTKYKIYEAHPSSALNFMFNNDIISKILKEKIEKSEDLKKEFERRSLWFEGDFVKKIETIDREEFLQIYQLIFSGIVDDLQMQELDMIDTELTANAIATQIMSANISHNIGSHGLSYFASNLESDKSLDRKKSADFVRYLQERQEYISMFATGIKPFYSPVNLNHFIAKRFNNSLLLNYIAQSEGYSKEGKKKIEISFEKKDNKPIKIEEEVLLPGGYLGSHAVFTMLEQKIRNVAKHQKVEGDLKIKFILKEGDDDFYEIELKDESGWASEQSYRKIKESLNSEFLRDPELVRKKGKGMLEMFISAGWLQGLEPAEIALGEKEDNEIIVAELTDIKEEAGKKFGHIVYKFRILKPKKVLVISNKEKPKDLPEYWSWKKIEEITEHQNYFIAVIDNDTNGELEKIRKYLPVRVIRMSDEDIKKTTFIEIYRQWIKEFLGKDVLNKTIIIYDKENNNRRKKRKYEKFKFRDVSDLKSIESKKFITLNSSEVLFFRHFYLGEFFEYETKSHGGYLEELAGDNFAYFLLEQILDEELYIKLIESAYTQVLILDERLHQEFQRDQKINYYKYRNMNICILTIEEAEASNLVVKDILGQEFATVNYDYEKDSILIEPKEKLNGQQFHFTTIHQGLIDRCYNYFRRQKDLNLYDFTRNFVKQWQELIHSKRVIIHSGRAIQHELIKDIPFIPFTALDRALRASKFSIAELMFSSKIN